MAVGFCTQAVEAASGLCESGTVSGKVPIDACSKQAGLQLSCLRLMVSYAKPEMDSSTFRAAQTEQKLPRFTSDVESDSL